ARLRLRELPRGLADPQAVRERRARRDPDRRAARVLPHVAEPDRGDGGGQPLPAGGLTRRDRPGRGALAARDRARVAPCYIDGPEPHPRPMRLRTPFLLAVVLPLAFAAAAPAVIIDLGDGTGNTSAPSPDPGWDHVG